ncbi:hypothetical protein QTP88_024272 [Uroleucon formosanum]
MMMKHRNHEKLKNSFNKAKYGKYPLFGTYTIFSQDPTTLARSRLAIFIKKNLTLSIYLPHNISYFYGAQVSDRYANEHIFKLQFFSLNQNTVIETIVRSGLYPIITRAQDLYYAPTKKNINSKNIYSYLIEASPEI